MNFTFEHAVNLIDNLERFGINPSLNSIKKLCKVLKNPQDKFPSIHVVGTNGKTSTTRFIAKILCSFKGSFGAYISPHIKSYTERFLICEKEITENRFAEVASFIDRAVSSLTKTDPLIQTTQFEFLTAMAFKYFEQERVRGAVFEAGMGGRWDATNAASSRVVVFMPIGLEHCKILGNTVKQIAGEKAGIINSGSDVILMSKDHDVINIVKKKCRQTSSRLFVFYKDFSIKKEELFEDYYYISFLSQFFEKISFETDNPGFQNENLLAAAMASALFLKSIPPNFNDIIGNVARQLRIGGRFEIISRNPLVILDGGHNPQAIRTLVDELKSVRIKGKKYVIFAAFNDKDATSMIISLLECADHFIFTSSNNKRSFTPYELLDIYKKLYTGNVIKLENDHSVFEDIETALIETLKVARPADAVIVTGSIANIGPAKEFLC